MAHKKIVLVLLGVLSTAVACNQTAADGPIGSGGVAGSTSGGGTSAVGGGGYGIGGGSGGYPEYTPEAAGGFGGDWEPGWGGMGGSGQFEVIAVASAATGAIADFALTDTHVYWLTYGTINLVTGRYNLDGALHRREIDGGEIETIADELEGPVRVEVTTAQAYVWLTKSTETTKHGGNPFWRVSVEGGEPEPADSGDIGIYAFQSFEDRAYSYLEYGDERGVYELAPGEAPRMVYEYTGNYDFEVFVVDGTHIYYDDWEDGGTYRQALDGGTPELLSEDLVWYDIAPDVDTLVGVATGEDETLDVVTMPTSGGEWQTIAQISWPEGIGVSSLHTAGGRWFVQMNDRDRLIGVERCTVHIGSVEGGAVEVLPEDVSSCERYRIGQDDIFVITEGGLLRVPLD